MITNDNKIQITLIRSKNNSSAELSEIINATNGYLIRNKGAVSDFNLIKDIVDRNIDNVDDEISNQLALPLYLGLMGTMVGIVVGLIFMPSISGDDGSDGAIDGVSTLLNGVKIAMVASVVGLAFTICNSYLYYQKRKIVEHQKNNFFTFIQTQLLPILSQNVTSSIYSLQTNLLTFNETFTVNISKFSGILSDVKASFDSQLQVVEELKRIDIENIAKYNVKVLKELQKSYGELGKFGDYMNGMNSFLDRTRELNTQVSLQLHTMGDIGQIVKKFDDKTDTLTKIGNYLESQYLEVETREKTLQQKIAKEHSNTEKAWDSLQLSFNDRIEKFNESDIAINTDFEKLYTELRSKTAKIFDDESGNIKAINHKIKKIDTLENEVNNLSTDVKKQNEKVGELVNSFKNKPINFNLPKLINVLILIFLSLGIVVFLSMILGYVINLF